MLCFPLRWAHFDHSLVLMQQKTKGPLVMPIYNFNSCSSAHTELRDGTNYQALKSLFGKQQTFQSCLTQAASGNQGAGV